MRGHLGYKWVRFGGAGSDSVELKAARRNLRATTHADRLLRGNKQTKPVADRSTTRLNSVSLGGHSVDEEHLGELP